MLTKRIVYRVYAVVLALKPFCTQLSQRNVAVEVLSYTRNSFETKLGHF